MNHRPLPRTWPLSVAARVLGLGLLAGLGLSLAQAQAQPLSGEIYTCTDAKGRKLSSDRPISDCIDREQKVYNPSGSLKARLGPTLTAKEAREQEDRIKAEQVERARLDEEKRRDKALLVRYPNPGVHDKERAQALAQVDQSRQTAIERVKALMAQKAKLTDEMAFYQKDPSRAPQKLQTQIAEVDQALAFQGRFMADKDAEIARIHARFDAEAVRLGPFWKLATPR